MRRKTPGRARAAAHRNGIGEAEHAGWIRDGIPDAPSVAARFSALPDADKIGYGERGEGELDALLTAGDDRLWKLNSGFVGRL